MELTKHVESLQRETQELEQRCARREQGVRAPAAAAEAELEGVRAALAEEEARLAVFVAELKPTPGLPVLTPVRSLLAALAVGGFTFGAVAGELNLTKASVGLLAAVWVAFLAGALRGR